MYLIASNNLIIRLNSAEINCLVLLQVLLFFAFRPWNSEHELIRDHFSDSNGVFNTTSGHTLSIKISSDNVV